MKVNLRFSPHEWWLSWVALNGHGGMAVRGLVFEKDKNNLAEMSAVAW
jgi:hypothetical protein